MQYSVRPQRAALFILLAEKLKKLCGLKRYSVRPKRYIYILFFQLPGAGKGAGGVLCLGRAPYAADMLY